MPIWVLFSFSDVDVDQTKPYTRATHEGSQSTWSHKLLPIPIIFKHEKPQCGGAYFKPYLSQTNKLQSLFSLALGIISSLGK